MKAELIGLIEMTMVNDILQDQMQYSLLKIIMADVLLKNREHARLMNCMPCDELAMLANNAYFSKSYFMEILNMYIPVIFYVSLSIPEVNCSKYY